MGALGIKVIIRIFEYTILFTVIPLILIWLGRLFPQDKNIKVDSEYVKTHKPKFNTVDWLLLSLFIVLFIGSIFIYFIPAGMFQRNILASTHLNSIYILSATGAFAIAGVPFGILVAWALLELVAKIIPIIIKKPAYEVAPGMFGQTNYLNIDEKKVSIYLICFLSLIFVILSTLAFDYYSVITKDGIIVNKYPGIGEKYYPYNNIKKIIYIKSYKNKATGETLPVNISYYSVLMDDGSTLDTLSYDLGAEKVKTSKEIIEFISQKSSVPVKDGIGNVDDRL